MNTCEITALLLFIAPFAPVAQMDRAVVSQIEVMPFFQFLLSLLTLILQTIINIHR
jgi:hypothetical protein